MKIKKHIPNILSSLRLLAPAVLIPLIISGNFLAVGILMPCFFITDALDGFLARKWHVESALGAKIDAVADKLMLGSFLVPLALNNPLIIINLVNEALISITNVIRKANGGDPKTAQIGRIKMIVISLFTILSYLTNVLMIPSSICNAFLTLTTVLQFFTLGKYIKDGVKEKNNFEQLEKPGEVYNNQNINHENELESELEIKMENDKLDDLKRQKDELLQMREELLNSYRDEILKDNSSENVKKYCKKIIE